MPKLSLPSRSRMVNFRVTEREYIDLCKASALSGRTLSEYARTAVLEFAQVQAPHDGSLRRQFMNLDAKLSRLIDSLDRVSLVAVK